MTLLRLVDNISERYNIDSKRNEVDLLVPDADGQFAYEIKAGSTFKSSTSSLARRRRIH